MTLLIGYHSQSNAQIDTFSLQYLSDTLVVSDRSLNNQFRLKNNSIYVSREARELAATFDDPSRVLYRHPGISTANDQANGIIYHGMPSDLVKWSIHGAEIVNPNHLSNAGTLSDLSSPSAGGVLAIPFDVINNFSFHANTHVENTPTTIGGVANFNFISEGQNFFKIGLLGLEAGSQTKNANIPVKTHFRYSTVGLIGQLGVDFGGEKIAFTDGFVQLGLTPDLHLISGGGFSSNIFRGVEDSELAISQKELTDIDFSSYFFYSGLVFDKKRNKHTLMFSRKEDSRMASSDFFDVFPLAEFENYKVSYAGQIPIFNKDISNFDLLVNSTYSDVQHIFPNSLSDDWRANFLFSLRYLWFNNKYSLSAKVGPKLELNQKEITPEISIVASRQFNASSLELSNSISTQEQNAEIFGYGQLGFHRNLLSTKSYNSALSYKAEFVKNQKILFRLFYHHIYDLPSSSVGDYQGVSPVLTIPFNADVILTNIGLANNVGLEIMFDQQFDNGFYFNTNLTYFDFKSNLTKSSTLFRPDNRNVTNNFKYIFNSNISKSWSFKNDKNLSANIAFHLRGGAFDYFDIESVERLAPYHRLDMRIQYEYKKSILSLDIQNLLNRKNDGFYFFDELLQQRVLNQQLGLIPVFSWKRLLS